LHIFFSDYLVFRVSAFVLFFLVLIIYDSWSVVSKVEGVSMNENGKTDFFRHISEGQRPDSRDEKVRKKLPEGYRPGSIPQAIKAVS